MTTIGEAKGAWAETATDGNIHTPGIVHDLGNMMQVLGSALGLLQRHPAIAANSEPQALLSGAIFALERVRSLARQLGPQPRINIDQVQVGTCILEIEQVLRMAVPPRISLSVEVEPDLPVLLCNRHCLENVLLNLIRNACDAVEGSGRIVVSARLERRTQRVLVEVADNGTGMSAEVLERAAAPYFTTKASGTGLGLAMAKRFTSALQGDLTIMSARGEGTTVSLALSAAGTVRAF
ncbi:ATP-binding protein [Sphingomonas sp. MAH-20]|uniref:histidine kinase n=1 Tax=Sphingomonas horti TaxID=2682842 RepID=A0A6I4IXZ4_9SPHN|nr:MULTISPECIES: ATP-binding protein [Sphingomonas]MBA2920852.1 ATP-binding protein [Sphingomonas sp. CGMCC 1.13658]MVO76838.1 ATP-binding protein [Sphingomonas horti]